MSKMGPGARNGSIRKNTPYLLNIKELNSIVHGVHVYSLHWYSCMFHWFPLIINVSHQFPVYFPNQKRELRQANLSTQLSSPQEQRARQQFIVGIAAAPRDKLTTENRRRFGEKTFRNLESFWKMSLQKWKKRGFEDIGMNIMNLISQDVYWFYKGMESKVTHLPGRRPLEQHRAKGATGFLRLANRLGSGWRQWLYPIASHI